MIREEREMREAALDRAEIIRERMEQHGEELTDRECREIYLDQLEELQRRQWVEDQGE